MCLHRSCELHLTVRCIPTALADDVAAHHMYEQCAVSCSLFTLYVYVLIWYSLVCLIISMVGRTFQAHPGEFDRRAVLPGTEPSQQRGNFPYFDNRGQSVSPSATVPIPMHQSSRFPQ